MPLLKALQIFQHTKKEYDVFKDYKFKLKVFVYHLVFEKLKNKSSN